MRHESNRETSGKIKASNYALPPKVGSGESSKP
jgi:hypothetical protein